MSSVLHGHRVSLEHFHGFQTEVSECPKSNQFTFCPTVHLSCKFGEIPTSGIPAVVFTNFYYMIMHEHTHGHHTQTG